MSTRVTHTALVPLHKFKPDLCWVLLQTRGVVDLASLFSITAFTQPCSTCTSTNRDWLPLHQFITHGNVWNHMQKLMISIYVYICSFIILAWTEISSPHYHFLGQHLVCAICDVMRCSIQYLTPANECESMGRPCICVQFIKSRIFLLQVMWESISVLWVMQESISGTASHATTLASYPRRVGANWLHAEWVAPPLAA